MAILHMDSFMCYGTASEWDYLGDRGYATSFTSWFAIGSYGRLGQNGLGINTSGSSPNGTLTLTDTPSTFVMSWYGSAGNPWMAFGEGGGNRHGYLYRNTSGQVEYRNNAGTALVTSSRTVANGGYYHFQLKVVVNDSTGAVYLYINGVLEGSATSVDTRNAGSGYINQVRWGTSVGAGNAAAGIGTVADLFITDGTPDVPLGNIIVQMRKPNGAGASTDMTPNTGANYAAVDDTDPDEDTTYVSETTVGDHDTYAFEDLTITSGTVYAVQHNIIARSDDGGSHAFAPVTRSGGTDYDGSDFVGFGSSYDMDVQIEDTDPDTASAWTISGVNSAEFGQKLTS